MKVCFLFVIRRVGTILIGNGSIGEPSSARADAVLLDIDYEHTGRGRDREECETFYMGHDHFLRNFRLYGSRT